MSERNRSLRRHRNGRQKQAQFQMIGAAATLLNKTTSTRNNPQPQVTTAAKQRDSNDDTTMSILVNDDDDIDTSMVSSDEEVDFIGLTEVDDEDPPLLHITNSAQPESTLVEDAKKPALELLALCQEVNAPLYLYDHIIAILKRHNKNGVLDVNKMPGRETLLQSLRKKLGPPIPYPLLVQTAAGVIEIPKFDFLQQLRDLLAMSYFNSTDNICANSEESQRFKRYMGTPKDELIEVCSCSWYNQTYDLLRVAQKKSDNDGEEVNQFLMPIIFYIDKTGTDVFQRYPLEPLMFTTAILRRDIRRKADSWRHVGFIPPVKGPESKKAHTNIQSYHNCLSALLEDFVELQRNPPKLEVNLGGMKQVVSVRLPVAFVIGDQVSQDVLCGKRQSSTSASPRIHRSCMCSLLHCSINGKPNQSKHVGCKPIPLKAIKQLTLAVTSLPQLLEEEKHGLDTSEATQNNAREIQLHKTTMKRRAELATRILNNTLGLHPICNAFDQVCFGSNVNGIHTATLNDIMHFNEGGLFLSLAQVAYGIIPPARRHDTLEVAISRIFGNTRSSVRSDYPRGFFKTGFSDMTLLTSVEKVGVVFALLVALRVDGNLKANLYEEGVVDSQEKYQSFPLGSSDIIKSDPDLKSEDGMAHLTTAKPKTNKKDRKKSSTNIATSKSNKTNRAAVKPGTKVEGKKNTTNVRKRSTEQVDGSYLQKFPLTMATHFIRKKSKGNKEDKKHYPLTSDVIKKVAYHLKLHDLREILDVDLDALQLHHLVRDVWEVVQKLTDASYPTTPHEILGLSEDILEIDDTTVAVYAFVPPKEEADHDPDYRESHFRLSFVEVSGLDVLKEQISAFDTHMDEDLQSMYGIEGGMSSPEKYRKLSKHQSKLGRTKHDQIQTKSNGDMVLFASSLEKNNSSKKTSTGHSYFITKHGREKKGTTTTRTFAVLSDVDTFCGMLEVTLLHHAYLHYSETMEVEERRDLSTLQRGIEHYMEMVDKCVYRGDNTLDNATGKFHCHYQTTKVIPLYGDPSQYEAGSCERGLKTWAKKASRTAQKNNNVEAFSFQTASRVSDGQLLAKACDMTFATTSQTDGTNRWINIWHKALAERMEQGGGVQKAGNYFFARTKPQYHFDMKNRSVVRVCRKGKDVAGSSTRVLDSEIQSQILYAVQNFEDNEDGGDINAVEVLEIWTELRDEEGKYLRATPCYPQLGPWYDWATVHFEREGLDYFLPAKCLLFYRDRHGEPSALIHGAGWKPLENKSSLLLTEWQKEYTRAGYAAVSKVPISSIQRGLLAFEVYPHDTPLNPSKIHRPEDIRRERVVVVHPRSTWASKFHTWCQNNI